MGKCIVCNKSAGPFYSLHKACYKIYEDTKNCLSEKFQICIDDKLQGEKLVETLQSCKPKINFSTTLFMSLFKRIWQKQAKKVLSSKPLNAENANYLLACANELDVGEEDVEAYLFYKLSNLEHLINIYENKKIESGDLKWMVGVELSEDESLLWVFEDTMRVVQQRYSEGKDWTILQSILNKLFSKSQYEDLAIRVVASGNLAISNKHYYYVKKEKVIKVAYDEIFSITPMKDGVRIQTTQRDTTPNTYETGDGRFTYALFQLAQNQID